jgi:hypothetical protein
LKKKPCRCKASKGSRPRKRSTRTAIRIFFPWTRHQSLSAFSASRYLPHPKRSHADDFFANSLVEKNKYLSSKYFSFDAKGTRRPIFFFFSQETITLYGDDNGGKTKRGTSSRAEHITVTRPVARNNKKREFRGGEGDI